MGQVVSPEHCRAQIWACCRPSGGASGLGKDINSEGVREGVFLSWLIVDLVFR